MLVVRVELWSAVTGEKTELARMEIANKGDSPVHSKGNYTIRTLRGRSTKDLNIGATQRKAEIKDWPRLAQHVWNLVAVSLAEMGYGKGR